MQGLCWGGRVLGRGNKHLPRKGVVKESSRFRDYLDLGCCQNVERRVVGREMCSLKQCAVMVWNVFCEEQELV